MSKKIKIIKDELGNIKSIDIFNSSKIKKIKGKNGLAGPIGGKGLQGIPGSEGKEGKDGKDGRNFDKKIQNKFEQDIKNDLKLFSSEKIKTAIDIEVKTVEDISIINQNINTLDNNLTTHITTKWKHFDSKKQKNEVLEHVKKDHKLVFVGGGSGVGLTEAQILALITANIPSHNNLLGLQGGLPDEYYHFNEDEHSLLIRLGEDSSGLTFDGLPVDTTISNHNLLSNLQGGLPDEYYHFNEDKYSLLMRLDEDSSGLTFDGLTVDYTVITDHSKLRNLNWADAGHLIDTTIDMVGNSIVDVGSIYIDSNSSGLYLGRNQNGSIYFNGTDLNIDLNNPSVEGKIKLNDDVEIDGQLQIIGNSMGLGEGDAPAVLIVAGGKGGKGVPALTLDNGFGGPVSITSGDGGSGFIGGGGGDISIVSGGSAGAVSAGGDIFATTGTGPGADAYGDIYLVKNGGRVRIGGASVPAFRVEVTGRGYFSGSVTSGGIYINATRDHEIVNGGDDLYITNFNATKSIIFNSGTLTITDGIPDVISISDLTQMRFGAGPDLFIYSNGDEGIISPATSLRVGAPITNYTAFDNVGSITQEGLATASFNATTVKGDFYFNSNSHKIYIGENKEGSIYFDGTDLYFSVGENPNAEGKIKLNDDVEITGQLSIGEELVIDETLFLSSGSITDSSGTIDFGNENLDTTGEITANFFDMPVTAAAAGVATAGVINQNNLPFIHSYGADNFFAGGAGNFTLTTAIQNVIIGSGAGTLLTEGVSNLVFGVGAFEDATTASRCAIIGSRAGLNITTASDIVAIGSGAVSNVTVGSSGAGSIVGIGRNAGSNFGTTSNSVVAIGTYAAGLTGTGGASCLADTFIGYRSGAQISGTLSSNTCIGAHSGRLLQGSANLCLGYAAGRRQTAVSNYFLVDNETVADAATELTHSLLFGLFENHANGPWLSVNGDFAVKGISYFGDGGDGTGIRNGGATNYTAIFTTGSITQEGLATATLQGLSLNIVAKTAAYTALATDDIISCGAGDETFTIDLPVPSAGKIYYVKNVGTGTITVDANTTGGTTIDNNNTVTLDQLENIMIVADATEYWVI